MNSLSSVIMSNVCVLSPLCIFSRHTVTYVTFPLLPRGLWVRIARKACWLAHCKMRPGVVGHPGVCGILHLTYFILGQTIDTYRRCTDSLDYMSTLMPCWTWQVCLINNDFDKFVFIFSDSLTEHEQSLQMKIRHCSCSEARNPMTED